MAVISALELPEAMVIGVIGMGLLPWLTGFCALGRSACGAVHFCGLAIR
jgi:hypothetical protein